MGTLTSDSGLKSRRRASCGAEAGTDGSRATRNSMTAALRGGATVGGEGVSSARERASSASPPVMPPATVRLLRKSRAPYILLTA